jgi:hypothetical protein
MALASFKKKALKLSGAINASRGMISSMTNKLSTYKAATKAFPSSQSIPLMNEVLALELKVRNVNIDLNGDRTYNQLDKDGEYSTSQRAQNAIFDVFGSSSNITGTSEKNYEIAADEFAPILEKVRDLMKDFNEMDQKLDRIGAPLMPNRLPNWLK